MTRDVFSPDKRPTARASGGSAAGPPPSPVCRYVFDGKSCRQRGEHRCKQRVEHALAFFRECLVHTRGDFAGRPFLPAAWQRDRVLAPLFGDVVFDEQRGRYVRKFRTLYLFVARKNGKSELIAGIMLFLLTADGEQGAELYGLAIDRAQAGHVFRAACRMIELSPALAERLTLLKSTDRILDPRTGSIFVTLASDAPGALGANPSGAYIDELLTQPDRDLYDALRTGMGARAQPLIVLATTAESQPQGFAASEREWSERVAEDPSLDPSRLVVMYRWPKDADWQDERNWYSVNPALGDFLDLRVLRDEFETALRNPVAERSFRQFRLNQPVNAIGRAIDLVAWDRCSDDFDESDLIGEPAYGGIDLAQKHDLCSVCWIFPSGDSRRAVWRIFTPAANLEQLDRRTGGAARVWVRDGWLTVTGGEVIDYEAVKAQLVLDRARFDVREVAYDPWGMTQLVQEMLDGGWQMIEHRQGWASMAGPTSELLRLVKTAKLQHGGNPVARWCAGNAVTRSDPAGNLKFDKDRSADKIDPIVAATMALARAQSHRVPRRSVYEERGMVVG